MLKLRFLMAAGAAAVCLVLGGGLAAAQMPGPPMGAAEAPKGQKYTAPRPDFVVDLEIPEAVDREGLEDGLHYLLIDNQVRQDGGNTHFYYRVAVKITGRAGLESASRLSASYDPSYQQLSFHGAKVIREGTAADRIDAVSLDVARQEHDLSSGIVDGDLTVFGEIPDVRVGDIIVKEMSWYETSELWPGQIFSIFDQGFTVPVERIRASVSLDKGEELTIKKLGPAIDAEIDRDGDGRRTYVWDITPVPAIKGVETVPVDVYQWPEVSVSTYGSWREVAWWGRDLYDLDLTLPKELMDDIESLRGSASREEQITWAIRYVQDDIRYVSNAVGLGAFRPRLPATTVTNGFGDCKDKAMLLIAVLDAMGVEAFPALTDLDAGHSLDQVAPSPGAFDHVIVGINQGRETIWIDATDTLQGGVYPNIEQTRYGFALPLTARGTLTALPGDPLAAPDLEVVQTWDFADYREDGLTMTTVTTRSGTEADAFRNHVDRSSASMFEEDWLAFYEERYPGITRRGTITFADDREQNIFTTSETYFLPAASYDNLHTEMSFLAEGIDIELPGQADENRAIDVWLPFPVYQTHTLVLDNLPMELEGIPVQRLDHEAVLASISMPKKGRQVEISYVLQTKDDRLPAEDAAEVTGKIGEFAEWEVVQYYLPARDHVEVKEEQPDNPLARFFGLDVSQSDAP